MAKITRHEARELAFVIVFEKSFQDDVTIVELIENALEAEVFPTNAFAENLAKKVYENIGVIDALIDGNLIGWSSGRISRVSRAVMRIAVCEIAYTDLPVGVAINEAVEIAKKYAGEQDASYINGVLGSVVKQLGK